MIAMDVSRLSTAAGMNGFTSQALSHMVAEPDPRQEQFDQFLREQREELVRFLRTRLSSEEDAQDAAQESFARLVRYRDTEPPRSWRPLLYRIAVNVALDQQRWAKTHRVTGHVSYEQVLYAVPTDDLQPDERLSRQQLVSRLWEVVQTLPPRCRDIYVLSRAEGLSQPQIAELYGISVKAVEKQITRALVTLRRELGDWAPAASLQNQGGTGTPS